MTRKLTTIIVASFVTVFALFLTGVTLMSYKVFTDFTSAEISEARLALLNESLEAVSNFSASVRETGVFMAANRTVIQTFTGSIGDKYDAVFEQRKLTELLNDVASSKRGIDSIEIYTDRYEHFPRIVDTAIFSMDVIRDEPWFQLVDLIDHGWIPKHESPLDGREMVSYVHRIMNHRGNTVGYVKVNVLADTFFESITSKERSFEGQLLVLNTGGMVIAETSASSHTAWVDELKVPIPSEPFLKLNEAYDPLFNHHQIIREGNEPYLLLISKYSDERWRLVHLIPLSTLYAKTKELGYFVLLLGLCGLMLSVPLAYWVGKRIIGPIRNMIQGMRQVERGRFDVRINRHYIEEYDLLARNFNHMTEELYNSMEQLKKENRARRDAEIRMLLNQITPHFLYNTLDVIHWKAMDHQAEDISRMVNQLSKMFRIGLSGGQSYIPLRDELEHAKCYIQIQKDRLNEHITYEVNVSAAIKGYYVPKIILQPFIENSMRHGYVDEFSGTIRIHVTATIVSNGSGDHLAIEITDNGIGFPEQFQMIDGKNGIGIKNVQERIWTYCGRNYGVECENKDGGGAVVRLRLPVIKNRTELQQWLEKEEQRLDGGPWLQSFNDEKRNLH